jgi:hypothetical protein
MPPSGPPPGFLAATALATLLSSRWRRWGIAALILATTGWWVGGSTINHDSAWLLYATARYLDGARLYVDIVEVNPPLAFWLTVPPAWVAREAGLQPMPVFVGYVVALAAISLLLVDRLLAGTHEIGRESRGLALIALLVVLVPCAVAIFGQREHLMLILAMPYLILMARRIPAQPTSPGLAVSVALFAAAGLLLKPYFLLMPAVVELGLLARPRDLRRVFRPETLTLGAAALCYGLAVLWLTPAYLESAVPLALQTYGAYAQPSTHALLFAGPLIIWLAAAVAITVRLRRRGVAPDSLRSVLLLAGAALLVSALVQSKTWIYHLYPAAALLAAWSFSFGFSPFTGVPDSGRGRLARNTVLVGLGAAAILVVAGPYRSALTRELAAALERTRPDARSFYAFSTNVDAAFPLVLMRDLEWPSRFPALWPLPSAVESSSATDRHAADLERIGDYVVDSVVADLGAAPPDVVFVDRRERKPYFSDRFDYLGFFLRDGRFAALWSNYEPAGQTTNFAIFRRKP